MIIFLILKLNQSPKYLLILEREEGRDRNREILMWERNINWLPLLHTLTGDGICNLDMFPNQESNPWPFGVQDDTSTNWATPARAIIMLISWNFSCLNFSKIPNYISQHFHRIFENHFDRWSKPTLSIKIKSQKVGRWWPDRWDRSPLPLNTSEILSWSKEQNEQPTVFQHIRRSEIKDRGHWKIWQ